MKHLEKFSYFILALAFCQILSAQDKSILMDNNGTTPRTITHSKITPFCGPVEAGNPWNSLGPFGGDVYDLATHPTVPGLVFAAAGYPYKSTDGGLTWQVVENLFSLASDDITLFEINSNGVIFAGGQNIFQKIYRSNDNGETWQAKLIPVNAPVLDIVVDPENPDVVYAGLSSLIGAPENNVVVKSENAGNSWTTMALTTVLPVGWSVINIIVDPENSQNLFVIGSEGISNGKVAASFDGGLTWENRTGNLPAGIPYNHLAKSGQDLYLAGGQLFGGQNLGLYRSTDDGMTWQNLSATFPKKVCNFVLIDPGNPDILYVATEGDGVYFSQDGGSTWTFTTPGAGDNGSARCMAFEAGNTQILYAGFLSLAVCKSTDGGQGWAYANHGIATLLTNDIEVDVNDPMTILVGFEAENSGGCYLTHDGGATWSLVTGLPATRYSQVTFGANGAMYAWSNGPSSIAQEGLYKSIDGGVTWNNTGPNVGNLFETQIFSLAASETEPGLIFIGGNNFGVNGWASVIHRTVNGGQTWENVYTGPDNDSFRFLFIVPNPDNQTVYCAYSAGIPTAGFMKSTDQGTTWSPVNNGIPSNALWSGAITCDPSDPDILYGGVGGYGDFNAKIYKSIDGGSSWTAMNITLSSYSKFTDIVVSPEDTDIVYAATTLNGTYLSEDAGLSWEACNEGLPAVNVSGFSKPYQVNNLWTLCASTFSNSSFITDIWTGPVSADDLDDPDDGINILPLPGMGDCTVRVKIEKPADIILTINDMQGRIIEILADGRLEQGDHLFRFTAKPGVYFIWYQAGKIAGARKVVIPF